MVNIKFDGNPKDLRTGVHIDGLVRMGMGVMEEVCEVRTPQKEQKLRSLNLHLVHEESMEYW